MPGHGFHQSRQFGDVLGQFSVTSLSLLEQ
jgi:hypothetical protein